MTSLLLEDAVINIPSAPIFSALDLTIFSISTFLALCDSTPNLFANSTFLSSKSKPITLHPLAIKI